MNRISSLGVCLVLCLAACGDDSVGVSDAGVSDGGLYSGLDKLGKQLGSGIDGVNNNIDDLNNRLMDLENPPPPPPPDSCSVGEDCIPDGLVVSEAGLTTLVTGFCKNIFSCCADDEIFLNFGPDVTDVKSCVARFASFANRGLPPDFFVTPVVQNIALIAQAFNSPGREGTGSVAFIDAGVKACAKQLEDASCASFGVAPAFCTPPTAAPTNECAPNKVVKGLLGEGEPCNLALATAGVPQCDADLACTNDGSGVDGICAKQAAVGDSCAVNADCATVAGTLYCNQGTQTCAKYATKGKDCSYVDKTLQFSGSQKDTCLPTLHCDPETEKCVDTCSIGASCAGNFQCPEDTVCDQTTIPPSMFVSGFCRDPFAKGDACTFDEECSSENCQGLGTCGSALKDFGDACTMTGAFDATCVSNFCGPDSKCTRDCCTTEECPDTHFCNNDTFPGCFMPVGECVPRITNGNTGCLSDRDCVTTAWCNAGTCETRVADSGACATGNDDQCVNRICDTSVCTAPLALDAACTVSRECGPDAYCLSNQCKAFRTEGQSCDGGKECADDLECDGHATTPKCYPEGEHPAGAGCGFGFDCLSGMCIDGECADPAGENEDCDTTLGMFPSCDAGLYCKTADAMTVVGTCKPQRTVGQSCQPRYMGADCLNGGFGSCTETYGGFFCGAAAVPAMSLVCDGT